jgi:hypothetical protein
MGRFLFVFAAFVLFVSAPPAKAGSEPVLTILYTGRSHGEYLPCPT